MKDRPMLDPGKEVLDRVRRIETRVTRMGNAMGIDVGGAKPAWDAQAGHVKMPSPNCSIADCLAAIPSSFRTHNIDLYVDDDYVCTVYVED